MIHCNSYFKKHITQFFVAHLNSRSPTIPTTKIDKFEIGSESSAGSGHGDSLYRKTKLTRRLEDRGDTARSMAQLLAVRLQHFVHRGVFEITTRISNIQPKRSNMDTHSTLFEQQGCSYIVLNEQFVTYMYTECSRYYTDKTTISYTQYRGLTIKYGAYGGIGMQAVTQQNSHIKQLVL